MTILPKGIGRIMYEKTTVENRSRAAVALWCDHRGRLGQSVCYGWRRSITGNPGIVYIYHGNKKGEANNLIDRNYLDPYTGFPGYKSYFCKIEKQAEVTGNAVSTEI